MSKTKLKQDNQRVGDRFELDAINYHCYHSDNIIIYTGVT